MSILWLLMPWLLMSPGHQQPWYWLHRIGGSWSSMEKDFNYLRHFNVEIWYKRQIYFYMFPKINSTCHGLIKLHDRRQCPHLYLHSQRFHSLRPAQHGGHLADNIFKCIFHEWIWKLLEYNIALAAFFYIQMMSLYKKLNGNHWLCTDPLQIKKIKILKKLTRSYYIK